MKETFRSADQFMDTESTQRLKAAFPRLFRADFSPFTERGYECGAGWFDLVYRLSADIEALAAEAGLDPQAARWPIVKQVKEKFGGLRYYVFIPNRDPSDDDLMERIQALKLEAEIKSETLCGICGAPGAQVAKMSAPGLVLCSVCEAKYEEWKQAHPFRDYPAG
jgi:hypothetical protein